MVDVTASECRRFLAHCAGWTPGSSGTTAYFDIISPSPGQLSSFLKEAVVHAVVTKPLTLHHTTRSSAGLGAG